MHMFKLQIKLEKLIRHQGRWFQNARNVISKPWNLTILIPSPHSLSARTASIALPIRLYTTHLHSSGTCHLVAYPRGERLVLPVEQDSIQAED